MTETAKHVCKWLSVYLCMRDVPQPDTQEGHLFDAVIVWKEHTREKSGGMAYEVILKPASTDLGITPSPKYKKGRPISQEFIEQKLKDADERRQSVESRRLSWVAKDKERIQEARKKQQEFNQSFSEKAKEKLEEKMENMEQNKILQMKALHERLTKHQQKVCDVRKMSEDYSKMLQEKIEKKLEKKGENRDAYIKGIQERIRDHEKHIHEVLNAQTKLDSKFSDETKEKMIERMENAMRNQEKQWNELKNRLQEHERHCEQVRLNKPQETPMEASN